MLPRTDSTPSHDAGSSAAGSDDYSGGSQDPGQPQAPTRKPKPKPRPRPSHPGGGESQDSMDGADLPPPPPQQQASDFMPAGETRILNCVGDPGKISRE